MSHTDEYRQRRALPGKAARKAELLSVLRTVNTMITHHIIAFVAGKDPAQDLARRSAEADRDLIVAELDAITKAAV